MKNNGVLALLRDALASYKELITIRKFYKVYPYVRKTLKRSVGNSNATRKARLAKRFMTC